MRRVCSKQIRAAHGVTQARETQPGEHVAQIAGQSLEEANDVFRLTAKLRTQLRLLGGDAGGAGIEVTLPRHVAAEGDQHRRAKGVFIGAQHRGDQDVARRAQTAIAAQTHAAAQTVLPEATAALPRDPAPRDCRHT